MVKFDIVSSYKDKDIHLPTRKTTDSAGYDFEVAEDIIIPSIWQAPNKCSSTSLHSLDDAKRILKSAGVRPTLVPTGIKVYLDKNTYLKLAVRSSCPLNYLLLMANGEGIIDGDYVDNPDNEGHIYFQMLNFAPFDIQLRKGDRIGQGIILPYLKTDNDAAIEQRQGGFGSTSR